MIVTNFEILGLLFTPFQIKAEMRQGTHDIHDKPPNFQNCPSNLNNGV